VQGHYRSRPDSSSYNNHGSRNSAYGGYNPYIGERVRERNDRFRYGN
jgi:hypothetical protein